METLVLKQASEKQAKGALKSFGKIAQIFGANAEIEPTNSRRALEEQACALQVIITTESGEWEKATCSSSVMKDIWSKELVWQDLKTLDLLETFGDKTALNPETNLYEKVFDENGNPVKERILTIGYAGTDTSALKLKITAEDLAKAESAKRSVNWENLIAL
jgi:hypothetical protein